MHGVIGAFVGTLVGLCWATVLLGDLAIGAGIGAGLGLVIGAACGAEALHCLTFWMP
ncbi:MAG: hypothetical protein IPK26_08940 [Planctomycetes bacterium]|nr:hypothetical protein [Planctomycetota bacterium]